MMIALGSIFLVCKVDGGGALVLKSLRASMAMPRRPNHSQKFLSVGSAKRASGESSLKKQPTPVGVFKVQRFIVYHTRGVSRAETRVAATKISAGTFLGGGCPLNPGMAEVLRKDFSPKFGLSGMIGRSVGHNVVCTLWMSTCLAQ